MSSELWRFLLIGYLVTIIIETPILLAGLSRRHSWRRRLFAGIWLTACTYPIVILVLPVLFEAKPRWIYLLVAEVFAPVMECLLFWSAFCRIQDLSNATMWRDFGTIVLANIASFGIGEILNGWHWFGAFN
jgi:hypothetical protein